MEILKDKHGIVLAKDTSPKKKPEDDNKATENTMNAIARVTGTKKNEDTSPIETQVAVEGTLKDPKNAVTNTLVESNKAVLQRTRRLSHRTERL